MPGALSLLGIRTSLADTVGLAFAVVYYFLFRFVIRRWNLKTPGREDEGEDSSVVLDPTAA